jgi:hypothetical protein
MGCEKSADPAAAIELEDLRAENGSQRSEWNRMTLILSVSYFAELLQNSG